VLVLGLYARDKLAGRPAQRGLQPAASGT
jgi:hypothetical protein